MGGCAGKNKSKSYKLKSNLIKNSEAKTKDDHVPLKSSLKKNLPSSNGSTVEKDKHISNTEENGIDPDVLATIKQSDQVNNTIGQIFASHVSSISDSAVEGELANLVYGHPERDYAENPLLASTYKSTEI